MSATYDAQNGVYVATLNQDGSAPKLRIPDAYQAERVYSRCYEGYIYGRGKVNAKVQAAINGEQPIPQSRLDEEGLGWMSNVNFRLLEADVNAAQVPFYMLFADVPQYAQVRVKMPNLTASQNNSIGQILGEEHKTLCDDWRQFDYHMQLSIANMVKYGSGPIYFPDENDFRFRAAQQGCVFVPDETTQDLTELPLLFLYYEWEITQLYREISHPKASDAGWDVENIKKVLVDACNEFSGFTRNRSWEYWEQKLREEDTYWSNVVPKVRTAWGYVKEFDGKITRFLITSNWTVASGKWLYFCEREFDDWSQIIHPFFGEIGNGNWNGVKGIGIKAYNFRDAQNRLKNRILDAAFLGSQILLQPATAKSAEDMQLMQMGPLAILPPADQGGVTFNQMPLLSTLDKPMAVDRSLELDLQRNIGGMRQNLQDSASQQPITAAQAHIDASTSAQLTQAGQTLWMRQLDDLYREQFKRLGKRVRTPSKNYPLTETEELMKAFRERCKARGVPDKALDYIVSVKATRSIGRGSEYFKQQLGVQVYQMLRGDPNVPQIVVTNHLRNTISNFTGFEYLEMIWPDQLTAAQPTQDMSKAQDENASMIAGVQPLWTPEQDNLAHATTHLQFLGQQVQGVQQGQMDPAQFLKTVQTGLPHVQQTLQALKGQGGNGKMFQQLWNNLEQVGAAATQIGQQYQAHQQAQAHAQQQQQQQLMLAQQTGQLLDPKSKVDLARVHADAAIKGIATQAEIQRKNALTAADIVHKNVKTRQDMASKDLQTAQSLRKNRTSPNGLK